MAAGAARLVSLPSVVPFLVAAIALALLASLVGRAVDALGDRLGAGATGVLQSALGNLPELFVCIFALRDGLYDVVDAALVGSVLANVLLVLGLAFVVGGLRHGTQRFGGEPGADARRCCWCSSVAAWLIPSLTAALHTPAAGHERGLSIVAAAAARAVRPVDPGVPAREGGGGEGGRREERRGAAARAGRWRSPSSSSAPPRRRGLRLRLVRRRPCSRRWTRCTSPRPSPASSSWRSRATRSRTSSASSSRRGTDRLRAVGDPPVPLQIALVLAPVLVLIAPLVGATFTLVLSPLLWRR